MSKGSELLSNLKGTRKFFSDLGRLLTAADGIMNEKGWESNGDSSCTFWTSASVSKGSLWLPRVAARHYVCPEHAPKTVAIITVILDDHDLGFTITEPFVSASYFVLMDEIPESNCFLDKWHALWGGYREITLDGTPETVNDDDEHWKPSNRFKHMRVFGRPLLEIGNQESLLERIVNPLIGLVSAYHKPGEVSGKSGITQ